MPEYTDYSLKKYNSFKIASIAKNVFVPESFYELSLWVRKQKDFGLWIGLGSNVLLPDLIEQNVVLTKSLSAIHELPNNKLYVQCGTPCAKVAKICKERGYEQGVFFAGIPGTMGGALVMNAGAFGEETWDHVRFVEVIDENGCIIRLNQHEFHPFYRALKTNHKIRFLSCVLEFKVGCSEKAKMNLKQCMDKRNSTQPIGTFNCGSVFKNPYPHHAASLIESCNLKGHSIQDASISMKHANFIENNGNASSKDIRELIVYIKDQVANHHDVQLETEVILI